MLGTKYWTGNIKVFSVWDWYKILHMFYTLSLNRGLLLPPFFLHGLILKTMQDNFFFFKVVFTT